MLRITTFLYLICLLTLGCENTSKEEKEVVETQILEYPSGKTKAIIEKVNGVNHGIYKSFHENGNPDLIANFNNGRLHGKHYVFWENGNIGVETDYFHGFKKGWQSSYLEVDSGRLDWKAYYLIIEGKESVVSTIQYDQEGKIIKETARANVSMKDTINLGEDFEVTFQLLNPSYEHMALVLADYDSLFLGYTKDSVKYFSGNDNSLSVKLKAATPGKQYLRGYIEDFTIVQVSDSTGESEGKSIFFEHSYYV